MADFNDFKPHTIRAGGLFRLLQRPCGLLSPLKKLRVACLFVLLLSLFRTGFGIRAGVRVRKERAFPLFQQLASGLTSYGIRKGVDRLYPEERARDVFSLPLEIREGALCFGRERFMKAGDQGLIKDSARFGLLSGLELSHSQIKKRIGVERPFPSAFL
jgi:hypothetical protein